MQAQEYIDANIPFLKAEDTVQFALDIMASNAILEMPVIQNRKYLGMVSEDALLNIENIQAPVNSLPLENKSVFTYTTEHVFELIKKMIDTNMFIMPILGLDEQYVGIVNAESVLTKFGNNSSLSEPGGMLVLEMNKVDYSLSEIARIVESNDAVVLNCFISSQENVSQIEVTLKINKSGLEDIIASFERYDYTVKAAYHQSENDDDTYHKFESLMHYLNM